MNKEEKPVIRYLSESAVLLSWDAGIDLEINRLVHQTDTRIRKRPFEGFIDTVPAYDSLAVFFDPVVISKNHPGVIPSEAVKNLLNPFIEIRNYQGIESPPPPLRIPVLYNGPDLQALAKMKGISTEELVEMHTGCDYDVFMLGFLPGFAYLGMVDERIAAPRLPVPRQRVPAGSVGIAGQQTGIYPIDSPGGWQLIGVTPLKMFDAGRTIPFLLKPGNRVRFYSIDKSEFQNFSDEGHRS